MAKVHVIGGGLAGSECAWGLAERGHIVTLTEMRPVQSTPAHQTGSLAELVCSNSFRSSSPSNAVGLLKEEMRLLGSLILKAGEAARVPAGDAFAVDREIFANGVTEAISRHPRIDVDRSEAVSIDPTEHDYVVVATGPLTSSALAKSIEALIGADGLYFYDAIAPIVAADSLDYSRLYWKSRYDKGDGRDYLNAPMNREEYARFLAALRSAELYPLHDFEKAVHFEGCLPIEELAARGEDTLRYGPMKPVGLDHPETGERPWAVVQLRKEDLSDDYFNIVGFQTKMKIGSQREVIRLIPGLENVVVARWGSMHRNTFINGPRHLTSTFQARVAPRIFFAGQITGVEGYVESAATGLLIARYIDSIESNGSATPFPYHTALGALGRHVAESNPERYQPSNVTWGLIEDVVGRRKKKEIARQERVERALETVRTLAGGPVAV